MPVCPFQKPLNELLSLALLVGLVGSADPARAQIVPLPTFNIEMDQTSISGLSSGGYMAVQFSVGFSALVKGVGVIAGGPYYCAQGDIGKATALCTCTSLFCGFYPETIDVAALIRTTDENARRGRIDPTFNLAQQRIWLFSGKADSIVPQPVMDALDAYFAHYVDAAADHKHIAHMHVFLCSPCRPVASREAWLCRSQTTCAIAFISPGHPEALDMFRTIAPSLASLPTGEPSSSTDARRRCDSSRCPVGEGVQPCPRRVIRRMGRLGK